MEYKKFFKFLLIAITCTSIHACDQSGWGDSSVKLSSKTLYVGFNGLSEGYKKQFYENEKSLESSWLKTALAPNQLKQLISQVDFEKQFVLVYSFGKTFNANGKIIMTGIKYSTDISTKISSIGTSKNIGFFEKKCNISIDIESFPFIVELVERPTNKFKLIAGSDANYYFSDGCTPPIAGKPTPE